MFDKIAENINILFNEQQQFHPQLEGFNLKGKLKHSAIQCEQEIASTIHFEIWGQHTKR
jgi:hypothetical protein